MVEKHMQKNINNENMLSFVTTISFVRVENSLAHSRKKY